MKQALMLLIGLIFFMPAEGQRSLSFGIHGNFGNKRFDGNGGYGADITFLIPVGPKGGIRFHTAIDRFPNGFEDWVDSVRKQPVSFSAIHAGYQKWLYSDNLFAFVQAGVSPIFLPDETYTSFSYGLGTGYKMNLQKSKLFQFTLSYQRRISRYGGYGWTELGAAYGFKFGTRKSFRRDD